MIRYCPECKEYTLHEECPECGEESVKKEPAKFKKEKDYSKQRLKVKDLI